MITADSPMRSSIWRKVMAGQFRHCFWSGGEIYQTTEKNEALSPDYRLLMSQSRREQMKRAGQSVIFDISNVAEFYYAGSDQEYWDWFEDVPCMASPFEQTWFEYVVPGVINSAGHLEQCHLAGWRYAASIQSHHDDDGWELHCALFQLAKLEIEPRLLGLTRFFLNEFGVPIKVPQSAMIKIGGEDGIEDLCSGHYWPVALAISFLHCKNVMIEDAVAVESRRHQAQDLKRGIPDVHYKVLNIGPISQKIREHQPTPTTGLKKALHICRGHFSEYSTERPLFGKYAGRFWIPAHIRGKAEEGTIVKDYRVAIPNTPAAVTPR